MAKDTEPTGAAGVVRVERMFISYRRDDCQPQANAISDGLRFRLPGTTVFLDFDAIPTGVDFGEHIRREVEICDLVLVLIGDDWLTLTGEDGARRIDDPSDFVRLEIEAALRSPRTITVPVLLEGAAMPRAADLPQSLRELCRFNSIEMDDRRWSADMDRLAVALRNLAPQQQSARMRLKDVDGAAVRRAVASMPDVFRTKDLSQNESVLAAHGQLAASPNYDTMVGRHLAANEESLGIAITGPRSAERGTQWTRQRLPP